MAEEIEGLDERRRDYSNLIPFPDKVLTDFAKRAKKAGLDFDQYTKFVKGTFKDGADEGRAIIKGREIFKDKDGLLKTINGGLPEPDQQVVLMQKHLEGSNINAVEEMIVSLDQQRQFELNVKLIKIAKDIDEAASNLMRMPNS